MAIVLRVIPILLVTFLAAQSSSCNAGVIINVANSSVQAGGIGSVNVFISSDAGNNVDLFQYKFLITPLPGAIGILRFADPQLSIETGFGDYIHAGDSAGFISNPQNSPQFNELLGGDFSASGLGTDVTGTLFFAQLDLEHVIPMGTPPGAVLGDQFVVSLVQDADTFLFASDSSPVNISSASSGIISITNAAAVPEPGFVGVMLVASITGVWRATRRSRLSHTFKTLA